MTERLLDRPIDRQAKRRNDKLCLQSIKLLQLPPEKFSHSQKSLKSSLAVLLLRGSHCIIRLTKAKKCSFSSPCILVMEFSRLTPSGMRSGCLNTARHIYVSSRPCRNCFTARTFFPEKVPGM